MTTESKVRLDLCGGVAGEYYISFEGQDEHIARFAEKCANAGVERFIPNFQIGGIRTHDWVISTRPRATGETESRGPYQTNVYGDKSPLRMMSRRAHEHGVMVNPYIHVPLAAVWLPKVGSPVGELIPLGYMTRFASEHPGLWTKTRDGAGFGDSAIFQENLGYGYLSLAYPEVREHYTSLCAELVGYYEVDGVTMEFIPSAYVDGDGVWTLGYDAPAIQAYREKHGVDPREVGSSDEAWARLRAGYWTQFLRELRREVTAADPKASVLVFETGGGSEASTAYKKMLDMPTWLEEGIIDVLYLTFGITEGGPHPWMGDGARVKELISGAKAFAGDRVRVCPLLNVYSGTSPGDGERVARTLLDGVKNSMEAGADGIGVYRADRVVSFDLWDTLGRITRGDF